MDETIPYLEYSKTEKPIENIIEDSNFVIRQIHYQSFRTNNGSERRFPNESHFKPDLDGLSVNLEKIINARETYIIIGLTYKKSTNKFKNPPDYKTFKFNVGKLKKISGINDIQHSPVFNGYPHPMGSPNNPGHSSVKYPDDEEIRVILSDWVGNEYESLRCSVDFKTLEMELKEIKNRLDGH